MVSVHGIPPHTHTHTHTQGENARKSFLPFEEIGFRKFFIECLIYIIHPRIVGIIAIEFDNQHVEL